MMVVQLSVLMGLPMMVLASTIERMFSREVWIMSLSLFAEVSAMAVFLSFNYI